MVRPAGVMVPPAGKADKSPMTRPLLVVATLAVGFAAWSGFVFADPGDACVTSYEGAQQARKRGELVRSKAELRLCMGACPGELSKDCERWLGEIDGRLSRLTVAVRSRNGDPIAGDKLFVDGVERPAGQAFELDPGRHELRAEAPGHVRRTDVVELTAGSRTTRTIMLDRGATGSDEPPSLVGPLTLGGAGLVALTVAAGLAIAGHLDVSDMRDEQSGCAPSCSADRVDRVRDLWTAGAVLAGAGGAAVIGASIWLGFEVSAGPSAPAAAAVSAPDLRFELGGTF